MLGPSVQKRLKSLDVYKNLPKDLTEPTLSGALVSMISIAIIVLLFFSELHSYVSLNTQSELQVDNTPGHNQLRVNLDIVLPRLPCDILSLDVMDIMGNHEVHVGGELLRRKLDKNGKEITSDLKVNVGKDAHENFEHDGDVNIDEVKKSFDNQEGCHLIGFININKVPGNFHISTHAFVGIMRRIFMETNLNTIDVSHIINHLSFGEEKDVIDIKRIFNEEGGEINPLDGENQQKDSTLQHIGVFHHYYLNVVPTTYIDLKQNQYSIHQFTVNSNHFMTNSLPAIYFRYDLSPVFVTITQENKSFLHFLVQVCAIIGGVFTVAGIIDSVLHKSVQTILKKAEMGKLS